MRLPLLLLLLALVLRAAAAGGNWSTAVVPGPAVFGTPVVAPPLVVVYATALQLNQTFLLAIDAASGAVQWRARADFVDIVSSGWIAAGPSLLYAGTAKVVLLVKKKK